MRTIICLLFLTFLSSCIEVSPLTFHWKEKKNISKTQTPQNRVEKGAPKGSTVTFNLEKVVDHNINKVNFRLIANANILGKEPGYPYFKHGKSLILILNNKERITFTSTIGGVQKSKWLGFNIGFQVFSTFHETVAYDFITRKTLERIGKAKSIKYKLIGRHTTLEGELKPETLRIFRNFAEDNILY
jgi:hypothetical protein